MIIVVMFISWGVWEFMKKKSLKKNSKGTRLFVVSAPCQENKETDADKFISTSDHGSYSVFGKIFALFSNFLDIICTNFTWQPKPRDFDQNDLEILS